MVFVRFAAPVRDQCLFCYKCLRRNTYSVCLVAATPTGVMYWHCYCFVLMLSLDCVIILDVGGCILLLIMRDAFVMLRDKNTRVCNNVYSLRW